MNRDPEQTVREEAPRYTRENPPSSKEAAQARIQLRSDEIAVIEAHLEHKEVEGFSDEDAYELWRRRATSALGYKKAELKFLERWMEPPAQTSEERNAQHQERALLKEEKKRIQAVAHVELEQQLTKRVKELVEAITGSYTRQYDITNMPEDMAKAKERYQFVCALKDRIEQEHTEVKAISTANAFGKNRVKKVLLPLHRLGQTVNFEESFLHRILLPDAFNDERLAARETIRALVHSLAEKLEAQEAFAADHATQLDDPPVLKVPLTVLESRREAILLAVQTATQACEERGFVEQAQLSLIEPLTSLLRAVEQEIKEMNVLVHPLPMQRQQQEKEDRQNAHTLSFEGRKRKLHGLAGIAQEIRDRAAELAKEILQEYTPIYSSENVPTNHEEATKQMECVSHARRTVQIALAEVTEAWCRHPLRRGDLSGVKLPLLNILYAAESEARLIRVFKSTHQDEEEILSPKKARWKRVCTGALTRAMLEGFALTLEEKEVLKELIADLASS